jgi:hypothetical protein
MNSVHIEESNMVSEVVHRAATTEDVYSLCEVVLYNNIPC